VIWKVVRLKVMMLSDDVELNLIDFQYFEMISIASENRRATQILKKTAISFNP
jgi:hypothetical protein